MFVVRYNTHREENCVNSSDDCWRWGRNGARKEGGRGEEGERKGEERGRKGGGRREEGGGRGRKAGGMGEGGGNGGDLRLVLWAPMGTAARWIYSVQYISEGWRAQVFLHERCDRKWTFSWCSAVSCLTIISPSFSFPFSFLWPRSAASPFSETCKTTATITHSVWQSRVVCTTGMQATTFFVLRVCDTGTQQNGKPCPFCALILQGVSSETHYTKSWNSRYISFSYHDSFEGLRICPFSIPLVRLGKTAKAISCTSAFYFPYQLTL